ncbi:MAG TPA: acyl-CoA dehydrogenase [Trebonia sp.]|jgi:alkylation response protein AidB-like acyl-CoA dehydrogenase|nr:acyl-CoA dehydrogenase [Trebonia sp.]
MDRFELRYTDYSLTGEQEAVRDAFREFFTSECPTAQVRAAEPVGYDAKLWRRLAELGAVTMGLPESAGGDGAGLVDLVIVAEEAGAALAPVPFAEHVAASRALAAYGAPGDLLAAAEWPVTLALQPGLGARLVPAGAVVRDVVTLAGDELLHVHAEEPPPLIRNQGSTPLARWQLSAGAHTVLATGAGAVATYQTARAEWKLLTAAALVGLTERALSVAVEFVKTRETMGVPVGSLQGVSFPLADVSIGVSGARNLVRRAAWLADNEPGSHPGLIEAAFAYAAGVATHGATTSAHMQGGLGFTAEADASLYFLRAKGWSVIGGDPARDVMAVGDALISQATASRQS